METAYFAILYSAPSSSCYLYDRGSRCINISLLLSGGGGGGYVCVEGVGDGGGGSKRVAVKPGTAMSIYTMAHLSQRLARATPRSPDKP